MRNYLIKDKKITGYAWCEEVLAGVAKKVPYNAEEKINSICTKCCSRR